MKLSEMLSTKEAVLNFSKSLKEDRAALNQIRQRIDELDRFVLGELEPIPRSLGKKLGSIRLMEKDRDARLAEELKVINRAFSRADKTRKTLYMAGYDNPERARDKFLLATENFDLAKQYAKGGMVIEVQPGAVTLDFDKQVGSPDGQEHHLFNRMQGFRIVEETRKLITVRPI
jgi:hypothetical protein